MQHLEIVTRARANQHLDVLCKNVLYSNFRSGSRSVSGMLRDPDSWRRIGQLGRLNARGYVEQLDLVRQVLNPPKHEWVAIAFFCMSSLNSMMKECHSLGYMPGTGDLVQIDESCQESAESDLEFIQRKYPSSGMKGAKTADPGINYAGLQTAKILIDYVNSFEVSDTHVSFLMRRDSCLSTMIVHMQGLNTIRRSHTSVDLKSTSKNHLMFVEDLTGARQQAADITIDNGSLSTVNGNLTLNPSIDAFRGARTNVMGEPNPYVYVEPQIQTAFLEVCLAFNLFDLTTVWFRDFGHLRWDQVDWQTFDANGGFEGAFNPQYLARFDITNEVFIALQHALNVAFHHTGPTARTDVGENYLAQGEYDEAVQSWAANEKNPLPRQVTKLRPLYGEGDYTGPAVQAEFSGGYPRSDLPPDYYGKPGFFDGYGPLLLGAVGVGAIVLYNV